MLDAAIGVSLVDDPEASKYPMPLTATGKYDVEVRTRVWLCRRCWLGFFFAGRAGYSGIGMWWISTYILPRFMYVRHVFQRIVDFLLCFVVLAPFRSVELGLAFRAQRWLEMVMLVMFVVVWRFLWTHMRFPGSTLCL